MVAGSIFKNGVYDQVKESIKGFEVLSSVELNPTRIMKH